MDLPAPELTSEEKPLIDLSNTPDLIRTASVKPSGDQVGMRLRSVKLAPSLHCYDRNRLFSGNGNEQAVIDSTTQNCVSEFENSDERVTEQ